MVDGVMPDVVMSDDVMSRVIRVIAETQRVPLDTIKPESTFEELKIDSLDGINIVFAIENEFNINVPDEAAKSLRSVRDVAEGVEKLVTGG
jgi:acyl carrier protein